MNKENLENKITDATSRLITMASDFCWNTLSKNCYYILSEIDETIGKILFEKNKIRKKVNEVKTPKHLEEITQDLALLYTNLYDINFYIYKATKDKTIIEIKYFLKTSHTKDFYETIKNNDSMWHCKVAIPPYLSSIGKPIKEKKKFDVNWQLGGIRYEWNLFLYRFKYYLYKTRKGFTNF
ncbi:hypothetical protein GOQ30_02880 [Flavobacterium sp. TP390]|uniref:Uncharacterized protein n=1 Tax=Flavobacterium profundi TaxID=1774945 RepID=A0A6I4IRZ9_9FLAO|nr:hypothetical protein [Flavobacterium profundi]MVO08107.1 hypothetical protein [Flavobacterium profundi]